MFISDIKARLSIAKRLNLDIDETMQDWEYEISDSKRLAEFITEYDKPDLTKMKMEADKEFAINSIILTKPIFNQPEFNKYISEIKFRLSSNKELHRETINY